MPKDDEGTKEMEAQCRLPVVILPLCFSHCLMLLELWESRQE